MASYSEKSKHEVRRQHALAEKAARAAGVKGRKSIFAGFAPRQQSQVELLQARRAGKLERWA